MNTLIEGECRESAIAPNFKAEREEAIRMEGVRLGQYVFLSDQLLPSEDWTEWRGHWKPSKSFSGTSIRSGWRLMAAG